MYRRTIPYKNFKDQPKNGLVEFNLTIPETIKLLVELQTIFAWRDRVSDGPERELASEEIIELYNALEEVMLSAYGVLSADGEEFDKMGRFKFERSALFPATMLFFLSDPAEVFKFIEAILPKDMDDLIKTTDANLLKMSESDDATPEQKSEADKLRARIAELEAGQPPLTS